MLIQSDEIKQINLFNKQSSYRKYACLLDGLFSILKSVFKDVSIFYAT